MNKQCQVQGRWVWNGSLFFPTSPLLLGYETHDQYEMISNSKSLILLGPRMNILFFSKVEILVLIAWSYRFPTQLCWLLSLEWILSYFEHAVQSLFQPLWYPLLETNQTKPHSPQIEVSDEENNRIRHVYLMTFLCFHCKQCESWSSIEKLVVPETQGLCESAFG